MRQHHQSILLHDEITIRESFIQFIAVLVDDIAETDSHITKSDDDVRADVWVLGRFEDFEEESVMLVAELRTNAEEFTEREDCRGSEHFVLQIEEG